MLHHRATIAAALAVIILSFFHVGSVFAQMSCADFAYGKPNYHEKMDELAAKAGLPDNYWSRYHEAAVRDLCTGNIKDVDKLVDSGFVKAEEIQSIAKVLGKPYKPPKRSETGKSYGYAREKFQEMGACNACADNIAQYYTRKPNSPCGILAKQALEGNPDAIEKLVEFPDYCQWKY